MKRIVQTLMLALCMVGTLQLSAQDAATGSSMQKLGHMNSQELLSLMPERAAAEAKMTALNEQLQTRMQALSSEYESKVQAFQALPADSPQSTITDMQEEILTMQQRIQDFQQNAEQDIVKKQEELLQPMLESLQAIIDEVAAAEGFSYIIDTSTGTIIYIGSNSIDITPMVKEKLGIQG